MVRAVPNTSKRRQAKSPQSRTTPRAFGSNAVRDARKGLTNKISSTAKIPHRAEYLRQI